MDCQRRRGADGPRRDAETQRIVPSYAKMYGALTIRGVRAARSALTLVSLAGVALSCGELTGPKSPSTPTNVTAVLISPTSVRVNWTASPQSDGVISYNVLRNGTKVAESNDTDYVDADLAQQQTYSYTISANCTSGVLSDPSPESPAATVVTLDATPPRVIANQPPAGFVGVSPAATVTATFSEPMDPATINATTFTLRVTATGAAIPGTVTYNATTRIAEFRPATTLPNPENFTATVTTGVKDVAGNPLAANFSWTFTTRDDTPPRVIASVPANGATGVAQSTSITVTFNEAMDASSINATTFTLRVTSSGAAVAGTVTYNATTRVATFTPNTPLSQNTSYTAVVASSVRDVAGNQMGADFQLAFSTGDNVAPTIISTVPADLATNVSPSVVVSATFSEPMNPSTINTTTFTLRVTATGAAVPGVVAYNGATNTATFTPSSTLAGNTTYTATVTTGAQDLAGNPLAASRSWTFITADTTPPSVTAVSPPNSATGVATTTAVSVTFSEPIDPLTLTPATFNLRNTATDALVPGAISYNPATNIATFTPTGPLANGTNYTVTVTTGVRDVGGNALPANFTSNFTTVLAADVIAPTVVSVVPSNGVSNVATNTQVTVTFSEPMNPTTINSTNVQLTVTTGGAVVFATVTYNAATNAAVITPTSPLANGTAYTVRVTTGVRDVAGNPLAAQFTSTFTTVADTTSPTVVATTPVNNATSVPVSSTVTVTFSEDMNPSTINGMTFSVRITTGVAVVNGVVSYNVSTRVATFTPTSALTANTNYTATVTTGARDLAGNGLTGNFTFFFTTAP